jgi:hypothetical protein
VHSDLSKMRLLLLVFLLQFTALTAKSPNNDLVWKLNHERKLEIITESQQQEPTNVAPGKSKLRHGIQSNNCFTLAGPYCQSIVAYFVGTFQSKSATAPNFTAEFQVRLDANLKKRRIVVDVEQWSEEFANSGDFELDFYYSNGYQS